MNLLHLLRLMLWFNLLLKLYIIRCSNNFFYLFFILLLAWFVDAIFFIIFNMILALGDRTFFVQTRSRFLFYFLIFRSGCFAVLDFRLTLYVLKFFRLLNPYFSRPSRASLHWLLVSNLLSHHIIHVRPIFWRFLLEMWIFSVGRLYFKVTNVLMVVLKLRLGDEKCAFQLAVLFGEWCVVLEKLFELAEFVEVEARAAMIKKIRYWELSPKK